MTSTAPAWAPAPAVRSLAERFADAGLLGDLTADLDEAEAEALAFSWDFWRRPAQAEPPGAWMFWFVRAGRGYGKTRTGAETLRDRVRRGLVARPGLIAPTAGDARDVLVEGESGILAVHPDAERPVYEPSKRRLTWPNGAVGTLYSADEPDRLRGPQHDWLWGDEPASWRFGKAAFDNAVLGLRLGRDPRFMLTGTPKPTAWLRDVAKRPRCVTTTGTTYENLRNLAPTFIEEVVGSYEGTRLGRQELHAEWLDDVEGALWTEALIEADRWQRFTVPAGWRIVVGVDPPGETAECGIVVAAAPARPERNSDAVVLADYSLAGRPEAWARQVVAAYSTFAADTVVVEANQGGDMVRAVIHAVDPTLPVAKARTRDGKAARAEPVATLYERHRVHHVGYLPMLESQMVTWVPREGKSPDRLDALVWAVAALLPTDALLSGSVISVADYQLPG